MSETPNDDAATASDDQPESIVRTTRDDDVIRERLQAYLARQLQGELEAGSSVTLSAISSPSGSGMSSETLLFDASWTDAGGASVTQAFVGRMAPSETDLPTFPRYDMAMQANVMRLAGQYGVPVPAVRWLEATDEMLGAPFFVMERLEGRVPSDVPTYLNEGWLFDASDAERQTLLESTVSAIAGIHSIDVEANDVGFLEFDVAGDTPLRRHVANQRAYYEWIATRRQSPLIERAFDFLESAWPAETSRVVSWGDSRIGNVMYETDGFRPVAILDWEMAGLGTRELDLGWLAFMHTFFQKLFESMGMVGLPDFLRADDIAEAYQKTTGHVVEDLRWYQTYAALRHAIIMSRINERMVHFGQAQPVDDPDDRIPHRATLEAMLDGSWWR